MKLIKITTIVVIMLAMLLLILNPQMVIGNIELRNQKLQQQTPTKVQLPVPINGSAFIDRAIQTANPTIHAAKKKILIELLNKVASDVFDNWNHREYWIALIGVESAYKSSAKSKKDAIGLGQLLPQFRDDFGKNCGLVGLSKNDLQDDFTNAYLSACYFRDLIAYFGGSVSLALISYNAGMNSKDIKRALEGKTVSLEPANHVTKINVLKDKVKQ